MTEVVNAKFAPGDKVRIAAANPPGHRRVPVYARGREGIIERICGAFPNPEELAYGFDGLPKLRSTACASARPTFGPATKAATRMCSNSRSTNIG